nr:transcriptional adapter ada2 [Quercus suber]
MFAHTARFCKAPLMQFYLGKAFGVLKAKASKRVAFFEKWGDCEPPVVAHAGAHDLWDFVFFMFGVHRVILRKVVAEVGGIEIPNVGELTLKEESSFSARVRSDESKGPAWQSSSSLTSETGKGLGSNSGNTFSGVIKKASNSSQIKDGIKMEEFQSDRSIGEKKPRVPGDEGPSMTELSGYNFKRQEFEIEYDNDAEQILADMEFKNTDSAADRKLKLRVLRIYSKRLDERKRRKDFILERNLLYPNPLEKSLLPKEREICQCYKVFMQFHSKEEHDELLKNIIEEQQIVKRIQDLQGARAAGY